MPGGGGDNVLPAKVRRLTPTPAGTLVELDFPPLVNALVADAALPQLELGAEAMLHVAASSVRPLPHSS